MRRRIGLACLALMLAVSTARGDSAPPIPPPPMRGAAGGLIFETRYESGWLVVILVGCDDGRPNCALARSKHLLGMEVLAVDGEELWPEEEMVSRIMAASADAAAAPTITLELTSHAANSAPIQAVFARR